MRLPRWTLLAATTALVLPVAGPALATAAVDDDTTFLAALTANLEGEEDCEPDELSEPPEAEEPDTGEVGAAETDEPATDEPATDEPATDEPATDEPATDEPATDEPEVDACPEEDEAAEEQDGGAEQEPGESSEDEAGEDEAGDAEDDPDADAGDDTDDDAIEADPSAHGALVSSVARCAPRGREAREDFGLNHGAFVSAAARGQTLEVNGQTFDLSTPEGAEGLCALVEGGSVDEAPDTAPELESQQAPQEDAGSTRPDKPGKSKDKAGPPAGKGGGPSAEAGPKEHKGDPGGKGASAQAGPDKGNGGGPPAGAGNGRGGPKR